MMKQFRLAADVRTSNPDGVRRLLEAFAVDGDIEDTDLGFMVRVALTGESAKELNRSLLSSLRKVERRTTLRAEWTANGTIERFFDYVSKGSRPA